MFILCIWILVDGIFFFSHASCNFCLIFTSLLLPLILTHVCLYFFFLKILNFCKMFFLQSLLYTLYSKQESVHTHFIVRLQNWEATTTLYNIVYIYGMKVEETYNMWDCEKKREKQWENNIIQRRDMIVKC